MILRKLGSGYPRTLLAILVGVPLTGALFWIGLPFCPYCGFHGAPVRIVYGLPSEKTLARAQAGQIKLGGCMVQSGCPTFYCQRCGADWGHLLGP